MVKLGYTILYVSDVTKSIEFYETAFGFERKFITPENDMASCLQEKQQFHSFQKN